MLKSLPFAIAIIGSCILPFNAVSAQHMNELGNPCESAGSMADTSKCWVDELKRADQNLNDVYSGIMNVWRDNPDRNMNKERLRAAQRAWIAYRDKACEAEAGLYGSGSAKGLARLACLTSLTDDRAKALRQGFWWQVEKFG